MSYTSKAEMVDRFGELEMIQLTDREITGLLDEDVLNRALADADALLDGYLRLRYAIPVDDATGLLSMLAADVTRYLLYDEHPTDIVKERYEKALERLKEIARGLVTLDADSADSGDEDAATASGTVAVVANSQVFTSDTLDALSL